MSCQALLTLMIFLPVSVLKGTLATPANGDGKVFSEWAQNDFTNSVLVSEQEQRHAVTEAIQCFCSIFKALPGNFQNHVDKCLGERSRLALNLCTGLVADSMPSVFKSLVEWFTGSCLEKQAWFPASESTFLPKIGSHDQEFWMRCATLDLPESQLKVLTNMQSALASTGAAQEQLSMLKFCHDSFQKGVIMRNLSFFNYTMLKEDLANNATVKKLTDCLPALASRVGDILCSFGKLSHLPNISDIQNAISERFVDPFVNVLLPAFGDRVHEDGFLHLCVVHCQFVLVL